MMQKLLSKDISVFVAAMLALLGIICVAAYATCDTGHRDHHHKHHSKMHGEMHEGLMIEEPWIRISGASAKSAAGYVMLHNLGEEDRLLGADSSIANKTEIHMMRDDNGVMKMEQMVDGLALPAGEVLVLKPASFHIMLMGLAPNTINAETAQIELVFEKAGRKTVEFVINPEDAPKAMDHAPKADY